MELRAALGVYDEIAGRFTVYTSAEVTLFS